MNKAVLKSLFVENFASFAERTGFTTEIDGSKKDSFDNTFISGGTRINRVSLIYGANGAGKTFFCKALLEIQRILNLSPILASPSASKILSTPQFKELAGPVPSFAFDTSYRERPTTFGLEIVLSNTTYHYEFSAQGNTITHELLTKRQQRTQKLLERKSPSFEDISLHSELKSFEPFKSSVRPDALCLSMAAVMNNPLAKQLFDAVLKIKVENMAAGHLNPPESETAFSKERIKKYLEILKQADGTLRGLNVSSSEEEVARQKVESGDFENREIISKRLTVSVKSDHVVYDNGREQNIKAPISFFADESLGTIKLFTLLPCLYDVLEDGGIFFMDELENGLHLSLAKEIVDLFNNEKTNPYNAQLICTSHQPLLLDGDFRRDQVWIVVKDKFGKSELHRLSELKTAHAKVKLTTQILQGAFGCNPEKFFDNHTL